MNRSIDEIAERIEQFMFERGEYDYIERERIKWLENLPNDEDAREAVLENIARSLRSGAEETNELFMYLDSEMKVLDCEDELKQEAALLLIDLMLIDNLEHAENE